MRRIEPTIGDTKFSANPDALKQLRGRAKTGRARSSALDWLGTFLLFLFTIGVCVVAASYASLAPAQLQLGTPQLFERSCILLGLLIAFGAQLVGCLLLFRHSFVQGGLALFLPGYIFLALSRTGLYLPIVGAWCFGVVAVVTGTILLA